jgi:hypothetical protein
MTDEGVKGHDRGHEDRPHGPVFVTGPEDPRVLDLRAENARLRNLVRRFRALGLFPAGQAVDALLAEADKELNR